MSTTESVQNEPASATGKRPKISLDTWAVVFALLAALLIRTGVLKHIPW
jgi:hypothetical protein